jgi:hypothetical protein
VASEEAIQKIPTSVIVGPFTYAVVLDKELAYNRDFIGLCCPSSKQIKIDPAQPDTSLPVTLFHEALHAVNSTYKIYDTEDAKAEEVKTHTLAIAIVQFIRANPEFIDWVQETK